LAPGLLVHSIEEAKKWIDKGIKIVPVGHITSILMKAYKEIVSELRGSGKDVSY
jgi:hypothetical protein